MENTMFDRRRLLVRGAAVAGAALLTPRLNVFAQSDSATPAATPYVPVDISQLPLRNPGQLTVHADQPLYPPFFVDNDPTNGQGFESALTYALGERMGFTKDQIKWGYTSF